MHRTNPRQEQHSRAFLNSRSWRPRRFSGCKIAAVLSTLVLKALLFTSSTAQAQEPQILPLREDIEFGVISSQPGICRMNRRGRLLGLAGQDCVGNGQSARFILRGTPGSVVNIQTYGSQSGNVRFTPRINGRSTKNLGGNGRRRISVFGDLQITGTAAGQYSLNYVMNINYE